MNDSQRNAVKNILTGVVIGAIFAGVFAFTMHKGIGLRTGFYGVIQIDPNDETPVD